MVHTFIDLSKKRHPDISLEEGLKIALDNEDYETAAKLRDKLKNK
jgi:protein-arginine kinase activator protein McsA